jgi:hypothetical protein
MEAVGGKSYPQDLYPSRTIVRIARFHFISCSTVCSRETILQPILLQLQESIEFTVALFTGEVQRALARLCFCMLVPSVLEQE